MYNKLKAIRSLYVRQLHIICQYSYIKDSRLLNSTPDCIALLTAKVKRTSPCLNFRRDMQILISCNWA